MSDSFSNVIFLISQPRSGSTLMQRLFSAHSQVLTHSEPWIMLHPAYSLKKTGVKTEYDFMLGQIATHHFIEDLPGGKKYYVDELRNMYARLYSRFLEGTGCSYFLDKTPRYHLIVPELLEIFPSAKYVLLIRNPLAVLGSIIDTWTKNNWLSLARFEHDIFGAIDTYLDIIENKRDKFSIIHYEDLLDNGEETLREVFTYLDLNFEPEVLQYHTQNQERWSFGDAVNVYTKQGIDRNNASRWQERLNEPQYLRLMHDYLNWIGRDRFTRLGYDYDEHIALLEDYSVKAGLDGIRSKTLSLQTCVSFSDEAAITRILAKQLFQRFCRLPSDSPAIVVYGHGTFGTIIGDLIPDHVLAFVDRKSDLVTTDIKKGEVYAPENVANMPYDYILISVLGHEQEIARYLIDTLGVDESKIVILSFDDI